MAARTGSGFGLAIIFFTSIVGLAMVAILISQKAATADVIKALASGTGNVIGAAVAPVTGSSNSSGN